jgi:antitoxin component YwqK of YwqJK toxin-antitoxin module
MENFNENILIEVQGIEIINDDAIEIDSSIIEEISSYCKHSQRIILVEKGSESDPDPFYTLIQLKDNVMHGTKVTFRDTGKGTKGLKVVAEIPWEHGTVHGRARYYWRSGGIMEEVPYVNGEVEGVYKCYKENGELIDEIFYERGEYFDSYFYYY